MKKLLIAILTLMLLLPFMYGGCGGGGGGGGTPTSVTPPETDITGTYRLADFRIDFYDSSQNFQDSVTGQDVYSYWGEMRLSASTISQNLTLEVVAGYPQTISQNANCSVTYTSGSTVGYFTITDQYGQYLATVDFTVSGNTLTTDSGLLYDPIYDEYFQEFDYWEKTSDSLSVTSLNERPDEGIRVLGSMIGGIVRE